MESQENPHLEVSESEERHILAGFEVQRYRESKAALKKEYEAFKSQVGLNSFRFGPKYHAETSAGKKLEILPNFLIKDGVMFVFILVLDSEGVLIGHRREAVKIAKNEMSAEGYISLGIRRQGVALPTETAFMQTIQSESNRHRVPVRWHVKNDNLLQMEKFNQAKAQQTDPARKKFFSILAAGAEQEQARFQSLYGPGGLLGFDEKGDKIFTPQKISSKGDISDVYLTRGDKGYEVQSTSSSNYHDLKSFNTARREELEIIMSAL